MSSALIQVNYTTLEATPLARARELIDEALAQAAVVGQVTNSGENQVAFEAQKGLKEVLNAIEKERKRVKGPLVEVGRNIDATARALSTEPQEEYNRLGRAIGDFQQAELARQRAAEAARLEELKAKERELQAKLAEAQTIEERETLREEAAEEERLAPPAPIPQAERPKGQVVREEWHIEVMDPWKLGRQYPQCVRITPMLSEIKALLDAGIHPPGVVAEKRVKAAVRASGKGVVR